MTDCRIRGVVSTSVRCFLNTPKRFGQNPWFSKGRRDDPNKGNEKKVFEASIFSGANLLLASGSVKKEPENNGLEDDVPLPNECILSFHVNLPGCIMGI